MHNKTLYACLTQEPTHQTIVDTYGQSDISNLHIARAAFLNGSKWKNNSVIKIGFLKGQIQFQNQELDSEWNQHKQDFTIQIINKNIIPLINLKFKWDVPIDEADVRISYNKQLGSFSLLGTQALQSRNTKEPTMNLGWIDDDTDFDSEIYRGTGIVIMHEFGHLLGMIHEHSRADAKLEWNEQLVIQTLGQPPNNWSPQQCSEQIFNRYKLSQFNGSTYDKYSVMEYYFPNNFFINKPDLPKVTHLSRLDKIWMNKEYPGKTLPPNIGPSGPTKGGGTGGGTGSGTGGDSNKISTSLIILFILIGVIILFIILYVIKKSSIK
jgi:hypothetical protein